MMGLQVPRGANPLTKFLVLDRIERDPPWSATIELARFDDAAFDPVVDDVNADPEAIGKLAHGEFLRSLERD